MLLKCNKSSECDGSYTIPGDTKIKKCKHHGKHALLSGASQPNVACPKADHCPKKIIGAYCIKD